MAQIIQAAPQRGIDRLLETQFLSGAPSLKLGRYIGVKAQRGSHTSQHNTVDVLISNPDGLHPLLATAGFFRPLSLPTRCRANTKGLPMHLRWSGLAGSM
jgi:hypothetical protein